MCVRESRGDEFVVLRNLVCCLFIVGRNMSQIINYIVINFFLWSIWSQIDFGLIQIDLTLFGQFF